MGSSSRAILILGTTTSCHSRKKDIYRVTIRRDLDMTFESMKNM
jgi:hypothetical protein